MHESVAWLEVDGQLLEVPVEFVRYSQECRCLLVITSPLPGKLTSFDLPIRADIPENGTDILHSVQAFDLILREKSNRTILKVKLPSFTPRMWFTKSIRHALIGGKV